MQSLFHFIPKVFSWAEVRTLFRTLKVFHSANMEFTLYYHAGASLSLLFPVKANVNFYRIQRHSVQLCDSCLMTTTVMTLKVY